MRRTVKSVPAHTRSLVRPSTNFAHIRIGNNAVKSSDQRGRVLSIAKVGIAKRVASGNVSSKAS